MVDARRARRVGYAGEIDFTPPWRRVTLRDAILEKTGIDILEHRDRDALAAAIAASDRARPRDRGPHLAAARRRPAVEVRRARDLASRTFIIDYPVELSPFAKAHRSEPGLVERFEAFADGMEIANAFTELNDPDEQRARFEAQVRYAAAGDEETQPFDEAFLERARARACRRPAASASASTAS